jgi:hypothetical protein
MPYKTKGKRTEPERVGDIRGEHPTNVAMGKEKAAKMASLLEGLDFPATRKEILHFINRRIDHKEKDKDVNDIINRIQNAVFPSPSTVLGYLVANMRNRHEK